MPYSLRWWSDRDAVSRRVGRRTELHEIGEQLRDGAAMDAVEMTIDPIDETDESKHLLYALDCFVDDPSNRNIRGHVDHHRLRRRY